jgi:hypothetical protein
MADAHGRVPTVPPFPVRSPLEAVHRLSRAVLDAHTPVDVTNALVLALRDGLGLGQVHLSEVSQGGEVGQATVAAGEGSEITRYVQVLDKRPSGVAWVVATGEPLIVPDARASQACARTSSSASTSPRWPTCR